MRTERFPRFSRVARVVLPALGAFLALSAPPRAQERLFLHEGVETNSGYGFSVAGLDDVDGDGIRDYLIGSMGCISANGGVAEVVSGATGALIRSHSGIGCFGMNVARLCDLDGDGVDEYSISAIRADNSLSPVGGIVWIYSGSDGAVLTFLEGDALHGRFGNWVDTLDDLDGDGLCELLITSPWDSTVGDQRGSADVYSGGTGALLHHLEGNADEEWFGYSAARVGDVDGDGADDFVLGAPIRWYYGDGTEPPGYARMVSGATGLELWTAEGALLASHFGTTVGGIADLSGDGVPDVLVGAPRHRAPIGPGGALVEVGAVEVRSGTDGALVARWLGSALSKYGTSVESAGDLDGDGTEDVLIGACYCQNSKPLDPGSGWVEVRSGADGSILAKQVDGMNGISFGFAVSALGDITADGVPDFFVGNTFDNALGFKTGSVWVYSGADLALSANAHELSIGQGGIQQLQLAGGPALAGAIYLVVGSYSGTSPGLDFGGTTLPLNFDGYLLATLSNPNSGFLVQTLGGLDANGEAEAALAFPPSALPPSAAGLVLHHAWVALTATGELALASNAYPLVLLP